MDKTLMLYERVMTDLKNGAEPASVIERLSVMHSQPLPIQMMVDLKQLPDIETVHLLLYAWFTPEEMSYPSNTFFYYAAKQRIPLEVLETLLELYAHAALQKHRIFNIQQTKPPFMQQHEETEQAIAQKYKADVVLAKMKIGLEASLTNFLAHPDVDPYERLYNLYLQVKTIFGPDCLFDQEWLRDMLELYSSTRLTYQNYITHPDGTVETRETNEYGMNQMAYQSYDYWLTYQVLKTLHLFDYHNIAKYSEEPVGTEKSALN